MMPSPSALIFVADGTEEMEFTITYDTLTRGGIICTSVYVPGENRTLKQSSNDIVAVCSRGVRIVPDLILETSTDFSKYDIIVVPGGAKGAETISKDVFVQSLLRTQFDSGKLIGMICAGSLAALTAQLPRQTITSHPSVKEQLHEAFDYKEESVVVSSNLITSRGPGTAFLFAFEIVEKIQGKAKRREIEGPMVFPATAIQ